MKRNTILVPPQENHALFAMLVSTIIATGKTPGELAFSYLESLPTDAKIVVDVTAEASTLIPGGKVGRVIARSGSAVINQLWTFLTMTADPDPVNYGAATYSLSERLGILNGNGVAYFKRVGDDSKTNTWQVMGRSYPSPSGAFLPNLSATLSIVDPKAANRRTLSALVDAIIDAATGPVRILADGDPSSNPLGLVVVLDMAKVAGDGGAANIGNLFSTMDAAILSANFADTMTVSGGSVSSVEFSVEEPVSTGSSGPSEDPRNYM